LGMHGTTFGGGPLACRVALSFLDEVERLLPAIAANGAYLLARLQRLQAEFDCIREVRGVGLMAGIELNQPGAQFVQEALEAGLVINCTHGNVLRLLPPFTVGTPEIDQACETLRRVLAA